MIKILICDDEAIIRQGIRKILENFYGDIEVRECGDGMEGYKTMAVWNPDAVITDRAWHVSSLSGRSSGDGGCI